MGSEKNSTNIQKHRIDFANIAEFFEGPVFKKIDVRKNYGEDRWIGYGLLGTAVVVVVYTIRDGTFRIISARKANHNEREVYYETFKK